MLSSTMVLLSSSLAIMKLMSLVFTQPIDVSANFFAEKHPVPKKLYAERLIARRFV